jgi:DNA replication protein DnaC
MTTFADVATQYRGLRFNNIADALETIIGHAQANELTYLQFAERLVEHELSSLDSKRITQNMRQAGFAIHKTLAEFDYRTQSTFSNREINGLLDFTFIEQRQNLIFIEDSPGDGYQYQSHRGWLQSIVYHRP